MNLQFDLRPRTFSWPPGRHRCAPCACRRTVLLCWQLTDLNPRRVVQVSLRFAWHAMLPPEQRGDTAVPQDVMTLRNQLYMLDLPGSSESMSTKTRFPDSSLHAARMLVKHESARRAALLTRLARALRSTTSQADAWHAPRHGKGRAKWSSALRFVLRCVK